MTVARTARYRERLRCRAGLVLGEGDLVDEFQRAWLLAQLGPDADPAGLERRFFRLRSVRAVALEVLGERRAKLLGDPLKVTVDGGGDHGSPGELARYRAADRAGAPGARP